MSKWICFVCHEKLKSKQNKFVHSFFRRIYVVSTCFRFYLTFTTPNAQSAHIWQQRSGWNWLTHLQLIIQASVLHLFDWRRRPPFAELPSSNMVADRGRHCMQFDKKMSQNYKIIFLITCSRHRNLQNIRIRIVQLSKKFCFDFF